MKKIKLIDQSNTTPPDGIPAQFEVKGVTYTVQSVDIESDIVEIKSTTGKTYSYKWDDLKKKLPLK